eukprot:SM000172S03055  [mRNA]  locus=s172:143740:146325:+ [translate_table: standard]
MEPAVDEDAAALEHRRAAELTGLRKLHEHQRDGLKLAKKPLQTLKYFAFALSERASYGAAYVARSRVVALMCIGALIITCVLLDLDRRGNQVARVVLLYARFLLWWTSLGVASSVGLGSGLHTFVLYLGPHIARFTLMSTHCGRLDIKAAPYDTPQWGMDSSWARTGCSAFGPPLYPRLPSKHESYKVPLLDIVRSVQLEAFVWGVGTAIGELPPYFVSREARLSGERLDALENFNRNDGKEASGFFDGMKLWMVNHARQFGFIAILAFASVPNPLFDLAGITCGHFLVPFWKFFLATLVGKAVVKAHIQALLIATVFNAHSLEKIEDVLERVLRFLPLPRQLLPRVMAALDGAKEKLSPASAHLEKVPAMLSIATIWNTIVILMLGGFLASIITSTARGYLIEQQRCEAQALLDSSSEKDAADGKTPRQ